MAIMSGSKKMLLMKNGSEDDMIAKLLAERKKKNAMPDSAKLAKEKEMEAIYSNKQKLDSMVAANDKSWRTHVTNVDATNRIVKKN
jgi:hypothetical protein